jgi:hypothetical protein
MKRALLLLTGGRSLPDMLVIKYLRPDIILNLTTKQGLRQAEEFKKLLSEKLSIEMEVLPTINPFSEQEIKDACRAALMHYPGADWIMHFTTSPKIVGMYGYEIAHEFNIPYWFVDTEGEQILYFIRGSEVDTNQFFKATVEEYMLSYGRIFVVPKGESYRLKAEAWYPVARLLAENPQEAEVFLKAIRGVEVLNITVNVQASSLVEKLVALNALTIVNTSTTDLHCRIRNASMLKFLKGDWLEVFIWREAVNAGFADDVQWGYKIVADLPSNELDVVLSHKARLLIAECKASNRPFNPDHLYKLHSVADLVGGNYVRQVFITHIVTDENDEGFNSFCEQARIRRTKVITGEMLLEAGSIFKDLATNRAHGRF